MHCLRDANTVASKRLNSGHYHVSLGFAVALLPCKDIDQAARDIANEIEVPVCIADGLL